MLAALRWANGNFLQESSCHTQVCCFQSPWPCRRPLLTHASSGDTQTLKVMSGSVSVGSPGVHKVLVEPSVSLASMGFDSKLDFTLPTILLGLPPYPWLWGLFLVGSNILLSTIVQQWVVILEFSQEKMRACPSTLLCLLSDYQIFLLSWYYSTFCLFFACCVFNRQEIQQQISLSLMAKSVLHF